MDVRMDDGSICDVGDLLRVGDAAAICGNSRASVLAWLAGRGRASRHPLPHGYAFKTDSSPKGVPVISRKTFIEWLDKTKAQALERTNKYNPVHVETTISYPADEDSIASSGASNSDKLAATEPAGTEVTTKDELMMAMMQQMMNRLDALESKK